nr:MoxR family ATPase [Desulfobacula sp.]
MDRFAMQLGLGYVTRETEALILSEQSLAHPIHSILPCVSLEEGLKLRGLAGEVFVSGELKNYMVALVTATREKPGVLLGASPRASLALMKTAQALALFDNMDFVSPDHIREIAVRVIAHRLILDPRLKFSGVSAQTLVEEILASIPAPV